MFDEYTQDYILEQMMLRLPDEVDTSEGSLVYSACSRVAAQLEEVYENLSDVYDNILLDGMDLDHLVASGEECGVPINYATNGLFVCKCNCELEIDSSLEAVEEDFTYRVVELISQDENYHYYKVEAEDEGTAPNAYLDLVEPEEVVDDFEYAKIESVLVAGEEEEDEDAYRTRRYEAFQPKPFAGNRQYYKDIITEIDGIGAVKLTRAQSPGQAVSAVIATDEYVAPTPQKVAEVQAVVDPAGDGEGNGVTPIGATVTVSAVTDDAVNFDFYPVYASGYDADDVKPGIESAIEGYLLTLRKKWEGRTAPLTVTLAKAISVALDVEGVEDMTRALINGVEGNYTLSDAVSVPVKGVVRCY